MIFYNSWAAAAVIVMSVVRYGSVKSILKPLITTTRHRQTLVECDTEKNLFHAIFHFVSSLTWLCIDFFKNLFFCVQLCGLRISQKIRFSCWKPLLRSGAVPCTPFDSPLVGVAFTFAVLLKLRPQPVSLLIVWSRQFQRHRYSSLLSYLLLFLKCSKHTWFMFLNLGESGDVVDLAVQKLLCLITSLTCETYTKNWDK